MGYKLSIYHCFISHLLKRECGLIKTEDFPEMAIIGIFKYFTVLQLGFNIAVIMT